MRVQTKSIKLEMTEEQLNIPIYFLGAIDIRNDAKVVEVALTFARSFTPASFFRSQSGTIWAGHHR
jgi:hypothetical protein